ncbi:MAG: ATP-binding protein [Gammaproteobacteria bacterium]
MTDGPRSGSGRRRIKVLFGRFSLLQQWVAATILSVLPLLLAVTYAGLSLQQQNSNQHALLGRVDRVGAEGGAVAEHIKDMIRLSRQYALLQEPSFLDLYRQKADAMAASLDSLRPMLDDRESRGAMDALLGTAEEIERVLLDGGGSSQSLSVPLQLLVSLGEGIAKQVEAYRRRALMEGEQAFNRIVRQLSVLTALALPGTLGLMIIGNYMVSRPLWRLSQAIQRLAEQDWEAPIEIEGPADLAALGRNLEWMRKQIISSERQTMAFIQHVTHELKTPIAAIIEAGSLLDEEVPGPLTSRQRSILTVLRTNARNLEHLIEQLLNYNAVSYGILIRLEEVDIQALFEATRARLEASNPNKKPRWDISGPSRVVRSDPRLLEMILRNLASNAFQFIPNGGDITIHWELEEHEWRLTVADNGPGIAPAELAHIYTPFFSGANDPRERGTQTGMGLSIVLECVHLLNGRIETRSTPGTGAEFILHFPMSLR